MAVKPGWARKRDRLRRREPEPHSKLSDAIHAIRKPASVIILLALGTGIFIAALRAYPSRAEPPGPFVGEIAVISPYWWVNAHTDQIDYTIDQARPNIAIVTVEVELNANLPARLLPGGSHHVYGGEVTVQLIGQGPTILSCSPRCGITNPQNEVTTVQNNSAEANANFGPLGTAYASFRLQASSLGVASNGVNAAAAFPELLTSANKTATLVITSPVRGAFNYDWSAYPPTAFTFANLPQWQEPIVPNVKYQGAWLTQDRVVPGVNHAAEANDSTKTLLVGVFLGLGTAIFLAGIQQALTFWTS